MTTTTAPDTLANLAARLTEPQDRETYAALISYFNALPPGDELFRLVQLLGLLSLLGQRVPEALADFLAELREQTKASAEYHAQVDCRLARLPQEIAAGVDADAIARGMSESFRQQVAATGLQDTAALLSTSAKTITMLSGDIAAALKPVTQEYKGVASLISTELAKLGATSRQVEEYNSRLMIQQRESGWLWQGLLALVLFLIGGMCGIVIEKRETIDLLTNVAAHIEQIQKPFVPMISPMKKNRKESD